MGPLPSAPEQVGPYRLVRLLGKGAMGAVFAAVHPGLEREVALKLVTDATPIHLRRFEVEARAAASLGHPNVVAVHDAGQDAGRLYLVMDLVEGESVDHLLRRGPLAPREAARIALAVARALAHAHARQVLER